MAKILLINSIMGISRGKEKSINGDYMPCSQHKYMGGVAFVREQLIDAIMYGWSGLLQLKQTAFDYFQEAVSFPLLHGSLGRPCTDELIEVIKIADYERGMRRQHFISVQHILFGLSLSIVGDIVRRRIFNNIELRSDLPMLGIYKLSSDAAKFLDDAKVGLEHFVFAILYGKQEKDGKALEEHSSLVLDYEACDTQLLDSLRKSATNCGVESFEDRDIAGEFILPDERDGNIVKCSLSVVLKRLNKALSEGMKLPLIREKV